MKHHGYSVSQQSIESELGGHEQLKTVLIDDDEHHEYLAETVKVTESATLIKESGGGFLYQKLILIGLIIPGLAIFFIVMIMPAMNTMPDLLCYKESTREYYPCTAEKACSQGKVKFTINSKTSYTNWIYDFGLVCEPDYYLKIAYYFFFVGFIVGALLIGSLADYIGRKKTLLLSAVMVSVIYLKFVFTDDVYTCGILLFLIGIFASSYYCVSIAYLTEIVSPESAVIYAVMFHLVFPLSGALVEVMIKGLGDWKIITTIMALGPLILITYFTYIAESPRYLAAKEQYDLAKIAANTISLYNVGYKRYWEFYPEERECSLTNAASSDTRNQSFFQHYLFFKYSSTKNYVASFALLLICIGFVFAGLVLKQKQIWEDAYRNALTLYGIEFLVISITGFLVRMIGHIKSIFLALAITGVMGIIAGIMMWINRPIQEVMIYVLKLFTMISFISTISLAAEVCPPRIRATGFGITTIMSTIGLICGGLILEIDNDFQLIFGIMALVSIIFLTWVAKLTAYSGTDDIVEIEASRSHNIEGLYIKYSDRKESLVIPVEGFCSVSGEKLSLGINSLKLSLNGELSWEGKDEEGVYSLEGSLTKGKEFAVVKKYKDGREVKYEGVREKDKVKGSYKDGSIEGEFELKFEGRLWVGEEETKKKIEWLLIQDKISVSGLGVYDDKTLFISGKIFAGNKLTLNIKTESLIEKHFEGEIHENSIEGKLDDQSIELKLFNI